MDQEAHGGISELSVGLNVFGVDVMNGRAGVLKSLSENFVSVKMPFNNIVTCK